MLLLLLDMWDQKKRFLEVEPPPFCEALGPEQKTTGSHWALLPTLP